MKFLGTLISVRDISKSKKFYQEILEQKVVDEGALGFVTLSGGITLQTSETWEEFIDKNSEQIMYGNNASELLFEVDNIDDFMNKLSQVDVEYVHPLKEHPWGQRAVRFYDFDKHIIEVGESTPVIIKRFINDGLTMEQIAAKWNVSVDYVLALLK